MSTAIGLVGRSQFVLEYGTCAGSRTFLAAERRGAPSGYDALPRFRQATVTPLALLKIKQGLQ